MSTDSVRAAVPVGDSPADDGSADRAGRRRTLAPAAAVAAALLTVS